MVFKNGGDPSCAGTQKGSFTVSLDPVDIVVRTHEKLVLPALKKNPNGAVRQGSRGPVVGELPILVDQGSGRRADQQVAVRAHTDGFDALAADLSIHGDKSDTVKARQSRSCPEPQITVSGLENLINGLSGQAALRGPVIVAILVDLLLRIKRPQQGYGRQHGDQN